ncbi:MAG TPA: type II secretion system F family protein [Candidatus Acidoferrales bacterium]|nr:type II secretion system F family protein [Candidatus Acidoferrales bacterium]
MKKAPKQQSSGSLTGFSYQHFSWLGNALGKLYSNKRIQLDKTLEVAAIKTFPEAYYSLIGFAFIWVLALLVPIAVISGLYPLPLASFIVLLIGMMIPKIKAKDRAAKLDIEVPFAGTYISTMATGGLSPYDSLRRLTNSELMPNLAKAVKDIEVDVEIKGLDPVTAMEKSAQNMPSKEYKDLLLGYASTLRTGGDVVHYLFVRTETMFDDLANKVRSFGDRAAAIMESYIALSILVTLSLTIIYMVSIAFSSFWQGGFTADTFLLYSYFLVPGMAIAFIYLSDSNQIQEPVNEWGAYKVLGAMSPVFIILLLSLFTPFAAGFGLPFAEPLANSMVTLRSALGLQQGYEASIGLSIALLVWIVPAAFAHNYYSKRGKNIEHDITNFLRDLTEARKTGASPEKCLENLAGRNYGAFTQHLNVASRQIRWGLPFKTVYQTFRAKIKSWMGLINMYVLVDAIEVGGGTPETLETLTRFSEKLSSIEKERQSILKPLVIMPYIGVAILLFSNIIFLNFMGTIMGSFASQSIAFSDFATLIMPPLVLQAFLTGLVSGKISTGQTSAGFKHAALLVVLGIVLMTVIGLFSNLLTMSF